MAATLACAPPCSARALAQKHGPKVATPSSSLALGCTHLAPRNAGRDVTVRAGMTAEEQAADLWQHPDRKQWYEAKFCADDQPDWNQARFVSSRDLTPGLREVTLEVEISRELVPLRNAYKHIGQFANVRVNGGVEARVLPSCAPFPQELNREPLWVVRGDLFAGDVKTEEEANSVKAELQVVVAKGENQDLWDACETDAVEVGPFDGAGLPLRGPIAAFFQYPTIVMFVSGKGIATARAMVTASDDVAGLTLRQRADVRIYYRAPNEASLAYQEEFEAWAKAQRVQVRTTTGSFLDAFDDDDTLIYDPENTAAVILTGADEEEDELANEACQEAEIELIIKDSDDHAGTSYLDSFTMPKLVLE